MPIYAETKGNLMFSSRAVEIAKCRTARKIRSLRGKSFLFQDMWISEKGIRVDGYDQYITTGLKKTVEYLVRMSLAHMSFHSRKCCGY